MTGYPKKIEMNTEDGPAHAVKEGPDEVWIIDYPFGGDTYYGTKAQAKALMRRTIKEAEVLDRVFDSGNVNPNLRYKEEL